MPPGVSKIALTLVYRRKLFIGNGFIIPSQRCDVLKRRLLDIADIALRIKSLVDNENTPLNPACGNRISHGSNLPNIAG